MFIFLSKALLLRKFGLFVISLLYFDHLVGLVYTQGQESIYLYQYTDGVQLSTFKHLSRAKSSSSITGQCGWPSVEVQYINIYTNNHKVHIITLIRYYGAFLFYLFKWSNNKVVLWLNQQFS